MAGTKLLTLPLLFALAAIISREAMLPQESVLEELEEMDDIVESHTGDVEQFVEVRDDFGLRERDIIGMGSIFAWNNKTQRCEEATFYEYHNGATVYEFKDYHMGMVVV